MKPLMLLVAAVGVGAAVLLISGTASASEPERPPRRKDEDEKDEDEKDEEGFGPLATKTEEDLGSGSSLRA